MATPLFFRQKVRSLAAALEVEHDGMLVRDNPSHQEFDQSLMERDFPTVWGQYAEIESTLWKLVMVLEDMAAEGPTDVYGIPVEKE